MADGTKLNTYVNSTPLGVDRYLLRFPDIVIMTTRVQISQNGPYKSGLFQYSCMKFWLNGIKLAINLALISTVLTSKYGARA